MKCSLAISSFLKRSLVFPILLFSSISLHWSLRKPVLSLFAILWNSTFKWVYLFFSPLLFAYLLFTGICKASSGSHFAFLHFFSMEMVLISVSCTMAQTSFHRFKGLDLIDRVPDELWTEVHDIVQETGIKTISKKKKCKKGKMVVWQGLTKSCEKKGTKRQRKKGKIYPFECIVPKNSKER